MTLLVAFFDDAQPPTIGASTAHALARLGVTDLALADGPTGAAVVLTGWAFDGPRHEHAVVELLGPDRPTRVMHAVADVTLRRGTPDREPS